MKTIIEMAREAGIRDCTCDGTRGCLERFSALVRADERAVLALEAKRNRNSTFALQLRARGNT